MASVTSPALIAVMVAAALAAGFGLGSAAFVSARARRAVPAAVGSASLLAAAAFVAAAGAPLAWTAALSVVALVVAVVVTSPGVDERARRAPSVAAPGALVAAGFAIATAAALASVAGPGDPPDGFAWTSSELPSSQTDSGTPGPTSITAEPGISDPAGAPVAAGQVPEGFAACNTSEGYALSCFVDFFDGVADESGVTDAVTELNRLYTLSSDTQFASYCHETAHALGKRAFAETGDRDIALESGTEQCSGGFYHGVWQSFLDGIDDESFQARVGSLCAEETEEDALRSWSCSHIVGHDIGRRSRAVDVNAGVELCREFSGDKIVWERCVAGAYMEYFSDVTFLEESRSMPASEVFDVCGGAPEDMKKFCYGETWTLVDVISENVIADAFGICSDHAEAAYVADCQAAVSQAVSFRNWFEPDRIIDACTALGRDDWSTACLERNGGVVTLSTGDPVLGEQVCAAIRDADAAQRCRTGVAGNATVVNSPMP